MKEHRLVFATLDFDEPWTLENYLKVDGYQAWRKILQEKTAQEDITRLQPSTHEALYGTVDRAYWRRPFGLATADSATTAAMGQEIARWLRPGGFLEMRLLRGGDEAQARAIAAQIPDARVISVPRGAISASARNGERPPGLSDEQWAVLQEAGADIRGEFAALGAGQFARIVRIYRGAAAP